MTAFAGIVTFDGAPNDIQSEEQIIRALAAPRKGRVGTRRMDGAVFGQRTAVETGNVPPLPGSGDAILFAADARLDNRAELGAALAIPPPELARTPDSILILRMHQRWGEAGLARCIGAFAFALWDAQARRLLLARDCLGNRALFFHRGNGFVAFASTLGIMLALPRVPREIDENALADFMVVNLMPTPNTMYRGIERVPSRTLVTIDRAGLHRRHYWSPNFDAPPPFRRDQDYIERARELFDQAVAAATSDTPQVAIATSGGLDSSAIAATVARLGQAGRINCYTMTWPAGAHIDVGPFRYFDERGKVEALARMHPALNARFFDSEKPHPFEQDNVRLFARANVPALASDLIGVKAQMADAIAAAGHTALLVGGAGNFGLSWDGRFSLLDLLRGGQWATLLRDFRVIARQNNRGLARTFVGEIVMPAAPVALRKLLYRLRGRRPDSVAYYSGLNPAFIAENGLVRRWREQGFDSWFGVNGWSPARYRAYRLFDHNQFGRDLRGTGDEWRGYNLRDPHGDRRLLEFLLSVPESMHRRNGVARSFARAVLADRLPQEIVQERRVGANGATWFRNLDANRKEIAVELEQLDASPLARRLIDVPRLKRLMREWPADEHAAEKRMYEYRLAFGRGLHIGRFIRWVEGGNA